jgi:hypothetical protein
VGYQVMHDLVVDGFNVDHVLIGPGGIYAVETKTISKPARGECRVTCDGQSILVNGMKPDRDPVVQAKAGARWLHDLAKHSTGKAFPVQPVVLYPGWFVNPLPRGADVWVLNEKAFIKFLLKDDPRMREDDVFLVAYHLKRYVIAKQE